MSDFITMAPQQKTMPLVATWTSIHSIFITVFVD